MEARIRQCNEFLSTRSNTFQAISDNVERGFLLVKGFLKFLELRSFLVNFLGITTNGALGFGLYVRVLKISSM